MRAIFSKRVGHLCGAPAANSGKLFGKLFTICAVCLSAHAQTNFFPLLICSNRAYTNCTIESVTPATAIVLWDGGGERIAITNLPADLLAQYHYDPAAAAEYTDQQGLKNAATQKKRAQTLEEIDHAKKDLGPVERIHIDEMLNAYTARVETKEGQSFAYIHNLPTDVTTFVNDFVKTKADYFSMRDASFHDRGVYRRQDIQAATTRHYMELLQVASSRMNIYARPSAYFLSSTVRQWEYTNAPVLPNGIPPEIYQGIVAKAANDWPDDYEMQEFEINKQTSAYRRLHTAASQ